MHPVKEFFTAFSLTVAAKLLASLLASFGSFYLARRARLKAKEAIGKHLPRLRWCVLGVALGLVGAYLSLVSFASNIHASDAGTHLRVVGKVTHTDTQEGVNICTIQDATGEIAVRFPNPKRAPLENDWVYISGQVQMAPDVSAPNLVAGDQNIFLSLSPN